MKLEPTQKAIYELALKHFGHDNQVLKTMEECGELIQALCKMLQTKDLFGTAELLEELADVQIMTYQMALLFGKELFEEKVIQKTTRLSIRLACELAAAEKE